MKTLKFNTSIYTLMSVLITAMILMSCSKDNDVANPVNLPSSDGYSKTLSAAEQNDLRFVTEKAKLMRNVYQVMYEEHEVELFRTISESKEQHMNLLAGRIDKYEVENPIAYTAEDEFEDYSLQQIYNDFLEARQPDLTKALTYIQALEEQHIADVGNSMSQLEGNGDIVNVYNLVLTESQTHLDAILSYTKGLIDIIEPFESIREL
ncbi:MAG: DUF2202 domain-containing protein [Bacteroidales bacterium]|nr:DUF2202 domain-containing protein [Bacteroidales bacterium]